MTDNVPPEDIKLVQAIANLSAVTHLNAAEIAYALGLAKAFRERDDALDEIERLRRVNNEWGLVMTPLIDGLIERGIKPALGQQWTVAALEEIDRLRAALKVRTQDVTGGFIRNTDSSTTLEDENA